MLECIRNSKSQSQDWISRTEVMKIILIIKGRELKIICIEFENESGCGANSCDNYGGGYCGASRNDSGVENDGENGGCSG
ncbi:Hypothetical predicted protein [Octopus vulgaris]|uniref:Uncharacterized protein n=1 Tax=Octopus vulgaris TaxID=6645 RepID=A0AA36AT25_OCTVU|nr:Hypothetical predicted protein [Octopus vulgaris]